MGEKGGYHQGGQGRKEKEGRKKKRKARGAREVK